MKRLTQRRDAKLDAIPAQAARLTDWPMRLTVGCSWLLLAARLAVVGYALLTLWSANRATGQEPPPAPAASPNAAPTGKVRIELPARDGQVAWADVIEQLAREADLDPAPLREVLPSGTIELQSTASLFTMRGVNLLMSPALRLSVRGNEALVVEIDWDSGADRLRGWKRGTRTVVERFAGSSDTRYGLLLDKGWERNPRNPVILVHGYNSRPESATALADALRARGWACGTFAYPNDGPLAPSGRQLRDALRTLGRERPGRRVTLLAHSMGGLVCRLALEPPDAADTTDRLDNVERLVMVATPNLGSQLARIPGGLDFLEHWGRNRDEPGQALLASVEDGFNEARIDMQPDSPLLRELNARPRRASVRYSLLLGDSGPLTADELTRLRDAVERTRRDSTTLRVLAPQLDRLLADLDELQEGKGDGAVALSRGRLPGVADIEVLPFSHNAFVHELRDPTERRLLDAIVKRLE